VGVSVGSCVNVGKGVAVRVGISVEVGVLVGAGVKVGVGVLSNGKLHPERTRIITQEKVNRILRM